MNSLTRRVVLGSASAIALSAAFAVGSATPASAQTEIYGGGATLAAGVNREFFNCFSRDLDRSRLTPFNLFDPVAKGRCTAPVANSSRWFGYASVGSGAGQRAFLLRNSAVLGVPSIANTVPFTTRSPLSTDITSPSPSTLELGTDGTTTTPAGGVDNPTALNTALPFSTFLVAAGSGALPVTGYAGHHYSFSEAATAATASNNVSFACYNGSGSVSYTVPTRATSGTPPIASESRTRVCPNTAAVAGPAIQVPIVGTSVNVPFNIPGRTTLNLSQRSLCRIFTGAATAWNDPDITADNGGVVVSTQPIRVVVRLDSSGTSALFSAALDSMCTVARTGVDWVGSTGQSTAPTWTTRFFRAGGNDGVSQTVARTSHSIGYTAPDVTRPAETSLFVPTTFTVQNTLTPPTSLTVTAGTVSAPFAARVQNRSNALARLTTPSLPRSFVTPSPSTTSLSLASAVPPSGVNVTNPAAWGTAAQVPDPTSTTGYPIVGFTYMLAYSCYTSTPVAQAVRGFVDTLTASSASCAGGSQYACIAERNQFAPLPTAWRSAVRSLVVTSATTKISGVTETGRAPQCTGRSGAGANLPL